MPARRRPPWTSAQPGPEPGSATGATSPANHHSEHKTEDGSNYWTTEWIMKTTRMRRPRRAALFAVSAVRGAATLLTVGTGGAGATPVPGGANPIVRLDD